MAIEFPVLILVEVFVNKIMLLRGSQNLEIKSHAPRPRPLRGRFIIATQGESVVYVCTNFEADSSIRSKVIRGSQNFEIGSHDPKPRPF